jgi:hypothetical protein
MMFRRFARSYTRLEREWLPQFDLVLAASENDRQRIEHPNVVVFPNSLPELARPEVREENCIAFSGKSRIPSQRGSGAVVPPGHLAECAARVSAARMAADRPKSGGSHGESSGVTIAFG